MGKKQERLVRWSYDEQVTPIEFIRRIRPLVCGPVRTLSECEGDMYLSDLRNLNDAFWRLENAVKQLDKEETKND